MEDLIQKVRQGNHRAVARLITQVENSSAAAEVAVTELYASTGRAHIIGVTGPPGSGKSTLVNELAKSARRRDQRVGIVAVDPSSPFTGGAILGDRVRMRDLSGDRGIFIRSMASRGNLGGLSRATSAVVNILDAAGFDMILVETVGAGQAEVDIATAAHTTLVIEAPGMGDDVQSIKAGILEIADVLVVNKADQPGAARTVRILKSMLQLGHAGRMTHHGQELDVSSTSGNGQSEKTIWKIPILETVAVEGKGIDSLLELILAHAAHLRATNGWFEREVARSRKEIEQLLLARLNARLQNEVPQVNQERLIAAVAAREIDPYAAVAELFAQLSS